MKKAIFLISAITLCALISVSPALAIGPQNAKGNPNAVNTIVDGGNSVTEIWLPSGVMNEWVNPGLSHSSGRFQVLDSSKAQIKNAIVAVTPVDVLFAAILGQENVWFYYSDAQFGALLESAGLDSSRADAYTAGLYLKLNFVG